MIVLDDRGDSWLVLRGDPGYDAVRTCAAVGIAAPVLPRSVLLGHPDVPLRIGSPPTGEAFLRWCTLRDCLVATGIEHVL